MLAAVSNFTKEKEVTQYRMVPVSRLNIGRYQRLINTSRSKRLINKIIANFNPGAFGCLMVNKRNDGKYYIYDGQHRYVAVKNGKLMDKICCQIIEGLTEQEEADLFGILNGNRKTMSSSDLFYADVIANKEKENMIYSIIESGGFTVERKKQSHNKINAIKTIISAFDQLHEDGLKRLLHLIKESWGNGKYSIDHRILKGMADFLLLYGEDIQDNDFIEKMKLVKPYGIIGDGDLIRRTSKVMPYAQAIWASYNKGRGKTKLADRFAR